MPSCMVLPKSINIFSSLLADLLVHVLLMTEGRAFFRKVAD